eukprot:4737672-Pleurochrysis_carterae.AAC.1
MLSREGLEFRGNVKRQGIILSRRWGARSKCRPPPLFPLQLPKGPLTPTNQSFAPFALIKELRPLEAVTKGDGLTRDSSRKQAASLGLIAKARVGQLVAERIQVGDVEGDIADSVTQTLIQVGRRALVTFRFGSTQCTARYAKAREGGKRGP